MPLIFAGLPLGNIEDISLRVLKALQNADIIACEDTRVFNRLIKSLDIKVPAKIISYFEHNAKYKDNFLLEQAKIKKVILVTDAGMPAISDPGWTLLRQAILSEQNLEFLPGPTAFLLALLWSGFAMDKFTFLGFAPRKATKLKTFYQQIMASEITNVFYESPHRIIKSLEIADAIMPKRQIALCRELTKPHQEIIRGQAVNIIEKIKSYKKLGEISLVIANR
ncbi:MAG: 16S rRNA (cytidine(1402)-2'-O)-methyltransferase [Bifidobacteriaceae bacterium]|jgi:16S rRNA (cytidine1402-2'-O)-methyltransferase|nr:16S rRNA (cytidine(1402)-2'-O)-methyltransferase [Bifidobacteriaceae bacterium]